MFLKVFMHVSAYVALRLSFIDDLENIVVRHTLVVLSHYEQKFAQNVKSK
jgi:hypothetical protein